MPFEFKLSRRLALAHIATVVTFAACGGDGITGSDPRTAGITISSDTTPQVPQVPPVATVTVTPGTASLAAGATRQLSAATLDASGGVLAGRTVTWLTSNAGTAIVDAGLVRGVAAGTATITATSEGKAASATITIAAPPPPSAECATPQSAWIWCDDFEQDRLSRYFEYENAGGNFVRTASIGYNGSTAMKARFAAGARDAGALHLAMGKVPSSYFRTVDAGTANYREIYWRMYVKHQSGWVGGGGDKLTRAFVFANSNWAQAAIGHVWSGASPGSTQSQLVVDPASGTDAVGNLITTTYNDFSRLSWPGSVTGSTPVFDAAHVGQWYCVESHMKLNSAGSSNGVLEVWVNGTLEAQKTGINFLGSFSAYGINAVYFENYWNAGSAAAQERYFDNIVVSTSRIGC